MKLHTRMASVALLVSALLMFGCDDNSGIDNPGEEVDFFGADAGDPVTTFSFPVEIRIDPLRFDPLTVELRLNGEVLDLDGMD